MRRAASGSRAITGAALVLVTTMATSQAQQLRPEYRDMLKGYDVTLPPAAPKPAAPPKPPEPVYIPPPGGDLRQAYAVKLRQAFLSNGVNLEAVVSGEELHLRRFDNRPHPRLIVRGPMNAVTVYRLVDKTTILRDSRDAGFLGLDFADGLGRLWEFDLSGESLPNCDRLRSVCLVR